MRNPFALPIPKLDIAAPSAARRLGDGETNATARNIARTRKGAGSGRPKVNGIDAAAPSAGKRQKPRPLKLGRRFSPPRSLFTRLRGLQTPIYSGFADECGCVQTRLCSERLERPNVAPRAVFFRVR